MTTLKEQIEEKGIILPFTGSNIAFGKQSECTLNGETFPVEVREAIRDEHGKIVDIKHADIEIDTELSQKLKAMEEVKTKKEL